MNARSYWLRSRDVNSSLTPRDTLHESWKSPEIPIAKPETTVPHSSGSRWSGLHNIVTNILLGSERSMEHARLLESDE